MTTDELGQVCEFVAVQLAVAIHVEPTEKRFEISQRRAVDRSRSIGSRPAFVAWASIIANPFDFTRTIAVAWAVFQAGSKFASAAGTFANLAEHLLRPATEAAAAASSAAATSFADGCAGGLTLGVVQLAVVVFVELFEDFAAKFRAAPRSAAAFWSHAALLKSAGAWGWSAQASLRLGHGRNRHPTDGQ
jgi:hypothetical protein